MTSSSQMRVGLGTLLLLGAALVVLSIGGTYLALRSGPTGAGTATSRDIETNAVVPAAAPPLAASGSGQPPAASDLAVTLSDEAMSRAGIEVASVGDSAGVQALRIPATIQPNAYQSVIVTPVTGGRVVRVFPDLGQAVRRGQTLVEVFSPDLAEAQTRYLATRAELDAHEKELRRTERLVDIGAASRQELERVHAEHTAATSTVESQAARLRLLGLSDEDISRLSPSSMREPVLRVQAPLDGIVTTREANAGVNVEPSTPLLTIVDLSRVWAVGDLYERDFGAVHVGSPASVTASAYPGLTLAGKVTYIDPRVKPETRTAQLRVEVPNPRGELRLGMFVEIQLGASVTTSAVVPRSALQVVDGQTVVYVADPKVPGRFVERAVQPGAGAGSANVQVSGVSPGDRVVSRGSFAVRAEVERLGLRSSPPPMGSAPEAKAPPSPPASPTTQTAKVVVSDKGFEPDRLALRAGVPLRITFVRTSEKTCGTEVVFSSLNIKRALPLNQPVDIVIAPQKGGEIAFACGMNMLRGTIVIQ